MLFINQYFLSLFLLLGFNAVFDNNENSIEENIEVVTNEKVSAEVLLLNANQGIVYFGDKVFSGVGVASYPNGNVSEEITYLNGKRNGLLQRWFENGMLSFEADYKENKLNGKVKSWWSNGNLRTESNFHNGVVHGVQQQWYASAQLFKTLNIVHGKEEGLQKAWRENGKLFVNYEAKDGRIFGLKRASLCYELVGENIVIDE